MQFARFGLPPFSDGDIASKYYRLARPLAETDSLRAAVWADLTYNMHAVRGRRGMQLSLEVPSLPLVRSGPSCARLPRVVPAAASFWRLRFSAGTDIAIKVPPRDMAGSSSDPWPADRRNDADHDTICCPALGPLRSGAALLARLGVGRSCALCCSALFPKAYYNIVRVEEESGPCPFKDGGVVEWVARRRRSNDPPS